MSLLSDLHTVLSQEDILTDEPLGKYTTFQSGGPCDYFLEPRDVTELKAVLKLLEACHEPWMTLGRGSNILVSDRGYRGAVIYLKKYFSKITVSGCELTAGAGAMMHEVARETVRQGLTGFEFASGIPGTVGGGLRMNAGAYGPEFKDIVRSADILLPDGTVRTLDNKELSFSYRSSVVKDIPSVVLSVTFTLEKGDPEEIQARIDDLSERRRLKQPLEYGSAGSTFKRPEGYYAGAVIEQAGLKGYRDGQAGVSEKHANFVVNYGGASSGNILRVIRHVQDVVREKTGLELEPEVLMIGEF